MVSDDILYSAFLSGDTSSYDELMIRHGDSLVYWLNGYLHDWHDAEDLMIEAFARIMVKKPKIGEGAFRAYLYKTARNLAIRFHERKSRFKVFSLEDLDVEFSGAGGAYPVYPEEELQSQEQRRAIHRCLERIDPALREVIWLVYFENMSYEQAAMVLGVNKKRVDHLLTRGKQHLRKELEKEGITDAFR